VWGHLDLDRQRLVTVAESNGAKLLLAGLPPHLRGITPFALAFLGLCLPFAISAQGLGGVLRVGAGVDRAGGMVGGGQVEFVDFGASSSVEVALTVFEAHLADDFQSTTSGQIGGLVLHDYHEDTRVRGAGVITSLLVGHGPRDSRGPYLALGLGLGLFDVDWHVESPTDMFLGSARPTGGSIRAEDVLLLGGLTNLGLGFRIHRRIDVRAQALTLLTPPTDARRDVKLLATFTLTAGVGI
jgi:hypothetical protein